MSSLVQIKAGTPVKRNGSSGVIVEVAGKHPVVPGVPMFTVEWNGTGERTEHTEFEVVPGSWADELSYLDSAADRV